MKKIYLAVLFLAMIIPLHAQSKKELRKQKDKENYEKIKELINSKNFVFEADWASTQKGRRINLTTNPNYLKVKGDQVIAYMPYFGVAHTAIGYSGDAGIKFEDTPENYSVDFNDKKYKVVVKFDARNKNETFNVTMTIFKNGNASMNITSSGRNGINYDGKVEALKD